MLPRLQFDPTTLSLLFATILLRNCQAVALYILHTRKTPDAMCAMQTQMHQMTACPWTKTDLHSEVSNKGSAEVPNDTCWQR